MKRKKEAAKQKKNTLREHLADSLDMAKEVVLDTTLISCVGDREMTLENYKSILAYSDTEIRVRANPFEIKIEGSHLELRNITGELLYITGRIGQVVFVR